MTLEEQFKEALQLEEQGNYTEALQRYTHILQIDNSYRAALINLGSLYYRMAKFDNALDCFLQALQLKEDYIVLFNIGSLYFRMGHYKKAIIILNKCNKYNPDFFIALLVKGIALSKLNNYKAALVCFQEVIKKNPSNKVALTAIILLYYEQKKYTDALHYLQLYNKFHHSFKFKDITSDIILKCAQITDETLIMHSLQKNEFRKFDEYIATVPSAVFNDSKGTITNKIMQLEQEIKKNPTPQGLISLSLCYLFTGNTSTAVKYLARAASKECN
ncbi:MAG: tetratricopeptide repeat protein [Spirochaetes bacterium]|nr:tetratricopeptide repeat protein [Spirochaetota bacterium]